ALKELSCWGSDLTELDVTANTALVELFLEESNSLVSLKVSNPALERIEIGNCDLTELDVSNCPVLKYLSFYNNNLTTLDVSDNTALTYLDCGGNNLSVLDVEKNTSLEYLNCSWNALGTLDVSANAKLTDLRCSGINLTSLDVSNNAALESLYCSSNKLASLNLSLNTELTSLYCGDNPLSSLNLSQNTKLAYLECYKNGLSSLDLSNNLLLEELYCNNNQLTKLDVSKNSRLIYLECGNNQVETLALNDATTHLWCDNNRLTSLDASMIQNLRRFVCSENQLTALDLSKNTKIEYMDCDNQQVYIPMWRGEENVYTSNIALNNPSFTDTTAITYDNGVLTSTDNTVTSASFEVDTGHAEFKLSGSIHFTYVDNADDIVITLQPLNADVLLGSINESLVTAASVADGSAVSYQWYSCTDGDKTGAAEIVGATGEVFPIPASLTVGTYYYFCRVSADGKADVDTDVAKVTVAIMPLIYLNGGDEYELHVNGNNASKFGLVYVDNTTYLKNNGVTAVNWTLKMDDPAFNGIVLKTNEYYDDIRGESVYLLPESFPDEVKSTTATLTAQAVDAQGNDIGVPASVQYTIYMVDHIVPSLEYATSEYDLDLSQSISLSTGLPIISPEYHHKPDDAYFSLVCSDKDYNTDWIKSYDGSFDLWFTEKSIYEFNVLYWLYPNLCVKSNTITVNTAGTVMPVLDNYDESTVYELHVAGTGDSVRSIGDTYVTNDTYLKNQGATQIKWTLEMSDAAFDGIELLVKDKYGDSSLTGSIACLWPESYPNTAGSATATLTAQAVDADGNDVGSPASISYTISMVDYAPPTSVVYENSNMTLNLDVSDTVEIGLPIITPADHHK
ncbi:MAG: hypothetical protein Q4D04_14290, partial [Clostridia bacterium]|nr:hypothetical protein [Clostridia bacterium]